MLLKVTSPHGQGWEDKLSGAHGVPPHGASCGDTCVAEMSGI